MKIAEIRSSYLDYFKSKGHLIEPSASLLPAGDPTLLFTTAGMVPFKDYFSGAATPPSRRIATVQKCFRTTDLEEVGKTKRHLSFFEMLGNFSFGDYFKKEAIEFAWEYVTSYLPFTKDDIWISIFENDDEAYEFWHKKIGVPSEKIVRLGKKDNFWGPAGTTGACGPCSELYLDRGKDFSNIPNHPDGVGRPGDEGERFMEFWNLVFNQFNLSDRGEYEPLTQTGIDTGAGLERLATLVQGVDSVYDTDELARLRQSVEAVYGTVYEGNNIDPIRVITDHSRALTFTMADGIYPSNESRGYVLRRLLRRGLLFGRKLGQKEPLLHKLVQPVVDIYGYFYPELKDNAPLIERYIESEEKRFLSTLDSGYSKIEDLIARAKDGAFKDKTIPGKEIFTLYDTFGFPAEMTRELLEQEGLGIDLAGFESEMEKQRERGKAAWKSGSAEIQYKFSTRTAFTGYDKTKENAKITEIYINGEPADKTSHEKIGDDDILAVVTDTTPAYGESGGQMGDHGTITTPNALLEIIDTKKQGDTIYHLCVIIKGEIKTGEEIAITIDNGRRDQLRKNHSATHLLNGALREKFGPHIKQSGSLVDPDYLRFDFTHPERLSAEEIEQIETHVNEAIENKVVVDTKVLAKSEAEKTGAVMNFGEKYGDTVRVVSMENYSVEFCGGTHVANTGDIELFLIQKESSPGAGNRRIEALSGTTAQEKIIEAKNTAIMVANGLRKLVTGELLSRLEKTEKEIATLKISGTPLELVHNWHKIRKLNENLKEIETLQKKEQKKSDKPTDVPAELIDQIIATGENAGSIYITAARIPEGTIPFMKNLADELRAKKPEGVYVLAGVAEEKWNLVIATTKTYAETNQIDLSGSVKALVASSSSLKGGGGGKKELAQGSGPLAGAAEASVLEELLAQSRKVLTEKQG